MKPILQFAILACSVLICSCSTSGNKKQNEMKTEMQKGTYGYDVNFFKKNNIEILELKDSINKSAVLIVPSWQARVMTSSANGNDGASYGWTNYKHIESGIINNQFNPFGGEERLWLGPEGGPFSIYFKKGHEQVFSNWIVPKEIDTVPFQLIEKSDAIVRFKNDFELENASGTKLQVGIERTIRLLNKNEMENRLGIQLDPDILSVSYETKNTLINKGENEWTEQTGALSIWMLSMFNPSSEGVVFIPFKPGNGTEPGNIVNDNYFGKVPSDRLIVKNGILFFKTDGNHRSKIGISPEGALPFCGSFDPKSNLLTLLWYALPEKPSKYVNSIWGNQTDPYKGDVVNSYNDGPVEDGSVMGPFYEIESSSPAAFLKPNDRITHTQQIFHITADSTKINAILEKLFQISVNDVVNAFNTNDKSN